MIKTMINRNLLERQQWYCKDAVITLFTLTAIKITTATLQCAWNRIIKQAKGRQS